MDMVYIICQATYGNGVRIGLIQEATSMTAVLILKDREQVLSAPCAAAPIYAINPTAIAIEWQPEARIRLIAQQGILDFVV